MLLAQTRSKRGRIDPIGSLEGAREVAAAGIADVRSHGLYGKLASAKHPGSCAEANLLEEFAGSSPVDVGEASRKIRSAHSRDGSQAVQRVRTVGMSDHG